jgi:uncharacterized oxidoreductase
MDLKNNTILITGGTSGIGFELSKQLLERGNQVIVTGRDGKRLEQTKRKLPKIHTIQSDVSDPKAIERLFKGVSKEFPDVNILINNAGIMRVINFHDKENDLESLTQEIEVNLMGTIRMVKQFLPQLKAQKTSAIVNVSSGLAFVPMPTSPVYCATKAAVHSFSESLRVQLKGTSVQVFELAPPATQTELMETFDPEDMKGIAIMTVEKMVSVALAGLENDKYEIRPGQANALKWMSRLAPQFILGQLSKPVDRMLARTKQ